MNVPKFKFNVWNLICFSSAGEPVAFIMEQDFLIPGSSSSHSDGGLQHEQIPPLPPDDDDEPEDPVSAPASSELVGGATSLTNVIVDDSPLQNQMQKNKECKSNEFPAPRQLF